MNQRFFFCLAPGRRTHGKKKDTRGRVLHTCPRRTQRCSVAYLVGNHGDARLLHGGATHRSKRRRLRRIPGGAYTTIILVLSPLPGYARRPGFRHRSPLRSRCHGCAGGGAPLLGRWAPPLRNVLKNVIVGSGRLRGDEMGAVASEVQRERFARLFRAHGHGLMRLGRKTRTKSQGERR